MDTGSFFSFVLVAVASGVLTIIAPCILSLLPIMLGSSLSGEGRLRPLWIVLGMMTSFAGFGLAFSASTTFLGLSRETLRTFAVVFIFVFGLALAFPHQYDKFVASLRGLWLRLRPAAMHVQSVRLRKGGSGAFWLGASMGLAWVPCAGPVLGIILTIATVEQNLIGGTALFLAYAIGAGIPMLLIGYGGKWVVGRVRWLAPRAEAVRRVAGAILCGIAAIIFFGIDRQITTAAFSLFADTTAVEEQLLHQTFPEAEMDTLMENRVEPSDFLPVQAIPQ